MDYNEVKCTFLVLVKLFLALLVLAVWRLGLARTVCAGWNFGRVIVGIFLSSCRFIATSTGLCALTLFVFEQMFGFPTVDTTATSNGLVVRLRCAGTNVDGTRCSNHVTLDPLAVPLCHRHGEQRGWLEANIWRP